MPNTPDWLKGFYTIDNSSGGSSIARGYNKDTEVVFTKYGEFSVHEADEGEFLLNFPEIGLYTIYLPDGELGFVCLELSKLIANLPIDELEMLANQGEDLMNLIVSLNDRGEELFISVYPPTGNVSIALESETGTVAQSEEICENFSSGYGGDIKIDDETSICFHVISLPDEFRVSIGEKNGDTRTLIPVSLSHRIDTYKFKNDTSSKRFSNLADQVIQLT